MQRERVVVIDFADRSGDVEIHRQGSHPDITKRVSARVVPHHDDLLEPGIDGDPWEVLPSPAVEAGDGNGVQGLHSTGRAGVPLPEGDDPWVRRTADCWRDIAGRTRAAWMNTYGSPLKVFESTLRSQDT